MPTRSFPCMFFALVTALTLTLVPVATAVAQDATPAAEEGITVAASGLAAPRAFTWGPDGDIYVAQSGPGITADATGAAEAVVKIVDGCPVRFAGVLPSTLDQFGQVLGPMDVQFDGSQLYILQAAGESGAGSPTPSQPNGIYTVGADGTVSLWLDLTSYAEADPSTNTPDSGNEMDQPYRFLYDGDGFWLIDSNRGLVFFIGMDKSITRIADLSEGHPVLTAMARDGQGGIYVGNLTPAPYVDGTARVVRIDREGNVEQIWSNLTTVTGLALDADGTLYALEMATGNDSPASMRPGTGRLLRQTGPDTYDVVAYGLEYPIDLEIGPDGAYYVSMPAFGPNTEAGLILRIPAGSTDLTVDLAQFDGATCDGAQPYTAPAAVPPGSPTPAS
jgi:hypothetical protein